MAQKHVFVTGGAGFIGSHIVNRHLVKGDLVWAVDNLQSGNLYNIEHFKSNSNFKFFEGDLRDWNQLEKAVGWADRIYHMAASVGQRLILADPIGTLNNNINSTERLLNVMSTTGSKAQFILASTSELYRYSEESADGSTRESSVIKFEPGDYIQDSYPIAKYVDELLALNYAHQKGLHCVIARLFNAIGTNQSPAYGFVVPSFINQALSGKAITVYGNGLQTRSFIDVRDTVAALDLLLDQPKSMGEIVNVGNDKECSILQLANLVKKLTGSPSEIVFVSYKDAYGMDFTDVRRRMPNLEKLRRLTNFKIKYTLENTLEEVLKQKNVALTK